MTKDEPQDYVPGKLYPLSPRDFYSIAPHLWPAVTGRPDYTRGRRFVDHPGSWEFWTEDGHKIHFSVDRDCIIGSMSSDIDHDRPEPQFPMPDDPLDKVVQAIKNAKTRARRCIKPECDKMVAAPKQKPKDGEIKGYRATGACCRQHATYLCSMCNRLHSYATKVGKAHLEHRKRDWDESDLERPKLWEVINA